MIDRSLQEGDRVVLVRDHPDNNPELMAGDTGTVCLPWMENSDRWVNVEWDKEISNGHTCDGRCENKHGWKVPVKFLDFLQEIEYDISDEAVPDIYELLSFMCE